MDLQEGAAMVCASWASHPRGRASSRASLHRGRPSTQPPTFAWRTEQVL